MLKSLPSTDENLTLARQLLSLDTTKRGRWYGHKFIIRASCATVLVIHSSFHTNLEIPP